MSNRPLLIAIAAMLLVTLGMGTYLLSLRRRALTEVPATYSNPVAPPVAGPTEQVTLYVAYDDPGILLPQTASIPLPEGRQQRARELLRALLSRYLEKSSPHPVASSSDVRDVYLVDPGLAVIDLNADFANGHRSGVLVEELTVASLVQTLAANIQGITRVKFLVDGKERDTLAGHADLTDAYSVSQVSEMTSALQASQ
jgi:Sporulation and spore germination